MSDKIDANDVARELGPEGLKATVEVLTAAAEKTEQPQKNTDANRIGACRSIGELLNDPETLRPPKRIPTTFTAIDKALYGGFVPGGSYLLVGGTNVGKSTMASNLARRAAQAGTTVLFLSLEDDPRAAVRKMLAQQARQPIRAVEDYADPCLDQRHVTAIDQGIEELKNLPLDIDGSTCHLNELKALIHYKAVSGTKLVVIDQTSWVQVEGVDNAFTEASKISREIKELAKAENIVILMLVQVNRSGATDRALGKSLELHHIRDSGRWEQDSDGVLVIQGVDGSTDPATMTISLKKHRHGPKELNCLLHFVPSQGLITDHPVHPEPLGEQVKNDDDKKIPEETPQGFANAFVRKEPALKDAIIADAVAFGLTKTQANDLIKQAAAKGFIFCWIGHDQSRSYATVPKPESGLNGGEGVYTPPTPPSNGAAAPAGDMDLLGCKDTRNKNKQRK
ncbi:MAG: DnaB-like helicase C-terminal domain-containing protein [Planctomycetota bacterium]